MKSKKNNKRIGLAVLVLIIAACVFIAVPLSAFCYEGNPPLSSDSLTGGAENEVTSEQSVQIDAKDATENDDAEQPTNVFEAIYTYIFEHIGEIFSALAFAGSIVLMLCYKKGFLPILKGGISALSGGVKSLGEETKSIERHAESFFSEVSGKLAYAEELLSKMSSTLDSLSSELGDVKEREMTLKRLESVLTGEVDMMYEIFMAAALPQYLKEKVGEQVAKMHRTIEESEKTNEA